MEKQNVVNSTVMKKFLNLMKFPARRKGNHENQFKQYSSLQTFSKHIFISNGTFGFSIISQNLTSSAHVKLHWILTGAKKNEIGALNTGHLLGHSAELIC